MRDGDADEQDRVHGDHRDDRGHPEVRVDEDHHDRDDRADAEQRELADGVAEPAGERTGEHRAQAGEEIDDRQLLHRDADVVDGERAAERHQHEAAGHQQRRGRERAQVAGVRDGLDQVSERAALGALQLEVRVDRLHVHRDEHARDRRERDDHQERRVPAPQVREIETERKAEDLARGERGLHHAHDPAALIEREQVGDDREGDRADHPAEDAGHHAREEQEVVGGRKAAEQRADEEAGVEEHQQLLAVEAIGEPGREEARDAGAERIDRYHQPEARRRDVKVAHEERAQRRQDHEVEDDRELEKSQDRDDDLLIRRERRRGGGRRSRGENRLDCRHGRFRNGRAC